MFWVVLLLPSGPSVRHWDRLWSSPIKESFPKPIHAVLSNYGYDTAQDRSRVGGNLLKNATREIENLDVLSPFH